MRFIGKAVRFVLVLVSIMAIFPAATSLAQGQQPIAQARILRNTPIIGWTGTRLQQVGMAAQNQQIGIYQYGQYPFGRNQGEYVRNSKLEEAPQFIKRSDLWELTGNETKSDIRPCQVVDYTQLSLGDGSSATVNWYKKIGYYTPLFAVALANPVMEASVLATPEVALVGVVVVGGYVVYKIYEKQIYNAITVYKESLYVLASLIAATVIVIPDALPGVPPAPDHIRNHPRGAVDSAIKMAIWNLIWNQILKGIPPDWCGRRADGSYLIVYFSLQVFKITRGVATRGVGIIFNPNPSQSTTAVMSIKKRADGRPQGGTFDPFVPLGGGCNPWNFLTPAIN